MMRPMPFWPSLEPWAKLTPEQVKISSARIGHGGGVCALGRGEEHIGILDHDAGEEEASDRGRQCPPAA